jgi:hypothetical protein
VTAQHIANLLPFIAIVLGIALTLFSKCVRNEWSNRR